MEGPEFVQYFWLVIEALKELGGSGRPSEVREFIARKYEIPDEKLNELLPSGSQTRFDNQVHWARFYLNKAGIIASSQRGVWSLSEKGRAVSQMSLADAVALFRKVRSGFSYNNVAEQEASVPDDSPLSAEEIENLPPPADDYRQQLLDKLLTLPAPGFEKLCQRLLRESGFEQVIVTGRTGDGGIDGHGILQLNPFMSFKVLFQCKRYSGSVASSQVRDFRGAMMGRADKGIILTTGTFTADAQKEALRDGVPYRDCERREIVEYV